MKLTLKHPLHFGKKTLDTLTFRDYTTAEDYLSFDRRGGSAQQIALIASLTGTDEDIIRRIRGIDFRAACKIADALMADDDRAEAEELNSPKAREAALEKKLAASLPQSDS
jgi:hypothetical protein